MFHVQCWVTAIALFFISSLCGESHVQLLEINDSIYLPEVYEVDSDHHGFNDSLFLNSTNSNSTNYYSSSFIQLNNAYFLQNQDERKLSDAGEFFLAFIRLFTIGFLIILIAFLSLCVLSMSLVALALSLDNVDFQLGIIRQAQVFNPDNPAVESAISNPKLMPPPQDDEENLDIFMSNNDRLRNQTSNLNIREYDFEHDLEEASTQSLTSFSAMDEENID